MTTVETPRFILRPFEPEDIDFLDLLHGDERVMRYILGRTRDHDENIAYLNYLIKLQQDYGIGQRLVIRKSDNYPVGRCGMSFFYNISGGDVPSYYIDPKTIPENADYTRVYELGYTFLRESWGQGYASEAAAAMQNYGLRVQKIPALHSIIMQENSGSVGVAEKIGATRLGPCLCIGQPGWDYLSKL